MKKVFNQLLTFFPFHEQAMGYTLKTYDGQTLQELTRFLQIINRINLTPELTRPPFNIDISPWVVPRRHLYLSKMFEWDRLTGLVALIAETVSKVFFDVSSQDDTTEMSDVL